MRDYLKRKEFKEIGESLEYGQKVRINHVADDCEGSSKSLLIERKEDGSISAYCFRCGRRGYYSDKSLTKSKKAGVNNNENEPERSDDSSAGEGITRFFALSDTGIRELSEWPPKARLWIEQYGITQQDIDKYGILYIPDSRRILFPVYSGTEIASYVQRKIYDDDNYPKYLTSTISNVCNFMGSGKSDTIVLVEDYLSGIKCSHHCDVLVLHGTNLNANHKHFLLHSQYPRHVIFLDDDNTLVQQNALRIKTWIDKFSHAEIYHSQGKDPKEYTDQELKEILSGIS